MKTYFPLVVDLKFYFTNENGDIAIITYEFPSGKIPTEEEVRKALEETSEKIKDYDLDYCTYEEYMNAKAQEITNTNQTFAFTIPDDGIWWSNKEV